MNSKICFFRSTALAFLSANLVNGETIASTTFDGQTLNGNTASDLGWTLNGVEDPGEMSAFVQDSGNAQNLFNSNDFNQNQFTPQINVGNGNTWWRTSVNLTVSAGSSVTLTEVSFDHWSLNAGGVQNVGRRSDFTITLYDPTDAVVGTASILDVANGQPLTPAGSPTPVSLIFAAPIPLSAPGTYRLEIDGGELGGADETGNHAGFDNLAIIGSTGPSVPFAITELEYDPNGDPGPTVTLTWTKTGAASYSVLYSFDLIDWGADLDDSVLLESDENPEDADQMTVTFPLVGPLENAPGVFFRVEGN